MTDPHLIRDRLRAADKLLQGETTTLGQVQSVRTILKGLNPKLDTLLTSCTNALSNLDKLEKLQKGDVITLSAEVLPETTEKEKKRKKALLLFLAQWKQLKGEVARIEKELGNTQSGGTKTSTQKTMGLGRILGYAKGPLGLITVVAAGLVFLNATSVKIHITNDGCSPVTPVTSVPIRIPGLSLPNETIPDGGTATAVIPRLTVTVDGTDRSNVRLSGYGLNFRFELSGGGIDLLFDGTSLLGRRTTINLGEQPEHQLRVQCR